MSEKSNLYAIHTVTKSNKKGKLIEQKKQVIKTDDATELQKAVDKLKKEGVRLFEITDNSAKESLVYQKERYQKNYRLTTKKL